MVYITSPTAPLTLCFLMVPNYLQFPDYSIRYRMSEPHDGQSSLIIPKTMQMSKLHSLNKICLYTLRDISYFQKYLYFSSPDWIVQLVRALSQYSKVVGSIPGQKYKNQIALAGMALLVGHRPGHQWLPV